MAISKIVLNGVTQIDLTQDTVDSADKIRSGYTGHTNAGTQVTGSYSGGSSKNIQYAIGRYETNSNTYVATSLSLKVSKAGTYKVYWSMDRNTTSGTNGSQLYKGNTAQGSAHTTWTHNGAVCEETLTLAANDVITVWARARNTSYYVGVSDLLIVEQ